MTDMPEHYGRKSLLVQAKTYNNSADRKRTYVIVGVSMPTQSTFKKTSKPSEPHGEYASVRPDIII